MNETQYPERPLDPPESREIQPDTIDLKQAREELAELVSAGKKVGRIDIYACLEAECEDGLTGLLSDLTILLGSVHDDRGSSAAFWLRALKYIERIAAKHLSDDDVMDRAVQNVNERDV